VQAETPPTVETLPASKHLLAKETAIAECMLPASSAVSGRGLASYARVDDWCVDGNFKLLQPEDETWRRTCLMQFCNGNEEQKRLTVPKPIDQVAVVALPELNAVSISIVHGLGNVAVEGAGVRGLEDCSICVRVGKRPMYGKGV
jgi:hypothetical protein